MVVVLVVYRVSFSANVQLHRLSNNYYSWLFSNN